MTTAHRLANASRHGYRLALPAIMAAAMVAHAHLALAAGGGAPDPAHDRPAVSGDTASGTPPSATPQSAPADSVSLTFKGQVVCAGCWGEADRSKVRYGTDADMKCALACSKKGIPAGLAVRRGGEFDLLLLAPGALQLGEKGWMPWMGKYASATGAIETRDGKRTLVVATLADISPAEAGFPK